MKLSKILLCGFVVFSLMLPYITIAYAADKPKYVGINEGQEIIWNTEFNKGPAEDYYVDVWGATEQAAAAQVDKDFENLKWNSRSEAWKMYIVEIRDEKSDDYFFTQTQSEEFNQVKFVYSLYYTKDKTDAEAWKKIHTLETDTIWEPDAELYGNMAYNNLYDGREFYDSTTHSYFTIGYTMAVNSMDGNDPWLIAPKNLKWNKVSSEANTLLEDNHLDDDATVASAKHNYFFQKKNVGLESDCEFYSDGPLTYDFPTSAGSIGCEMKFTDDGILYYYNLNYDGKTIAQFELDTIGGVYLIENWWWMALIAGAVILGVIIIIVIIAVKRR